MEEHHLEQSQTRLSRAERQELILSTAAHLFATRSIRAVGMDELIRETGLSKMSVYRLFPSKDELVGAYLRRTSSQVLAMIDEAVAPHQDDPKAALKVMFDLVDHDTLREGFRGAPFQNASVEFHEYNHPARVATRDHEQAVYERLLSLTRRLEPEALAVETAAWLHLLIGGMYGSAAILGPHGPVAHGRALVDQIIDGR